MNTHDLAMLVPELMAPHPGHTWSLLSGGGHGVDLDFEVRPVAAPSRVATVVVLASAEVYHVSFEGHTDTDFAYDDADRPDALRRRIELAAAATTGPTRVTLKLAGETVIRSELVLDPDGPGPPGGRAGLLPPSATESLPVSSPGGRKGPRLPRHHIELSVQSRQAQTHATAARRAFA